MAMKVNTVIVGRCEHGVLQTCGAASDDLSDPKDAVQAAEWIRDGLRVERMTVEAFRAEPGFMECPACESPTKGQS